MKKQLQTPLHKIKLFQFRDFDMAVFVEKYLKVITPHEEIDGDTLSVYAPAQTKLTDAATGAHKPDVIENKCRFLQDTIIRRAYSQKDQSRKFALNSSLLCDVIGKDYRALLDTLIEMGYLHYCGDPERYCAGRYSSTYTISAAEIEQKPPIINATIQYYQERLNAGIRTYTTSYTYPAIKELYGDAFLNRYISSLSTIHIEDQEGFNAYTAETISLSATTEPYFTYIRKELEKKDKTIYRIDNSHRIYHILTNLKREIKQYLNIDIQLDCKNSHPLLFNFFIFNTLSIPVPSSYNISSFFSSLYISSSPTEYHYVRKNLRNILIDNDIENEAVAKMTDDELEYVYMTTNGLLWDDFCALYPDLDRREIKKALFAAVFYSPSPVSARWNGLARVFKAQYPAVYELIGDWKRKSMQGSVVEYMKAHDLPSDRGAASLSIAMMGLESEIFTSILQRLYRKRWNAVHIHDCIVIPADGNKNHPEAEQVRSIMEEVYANYGLCPTFDVKSVSKVRS